MRRIVWPAGLRPLRITVLDGPKSKGMTESVTDAIQTVSQPYGAIRYQFDFPPLRGRAAAEFTGLLAALEDGANWTGAPCLYGHGPGFVDLGLSVPPPSIPWGNNRPWDNGAYWSPSRPAAETSAASAIDARTVTLDTSEWNNTIWPGIQIGFLHFGAYWIQEVTDQVGSIATCRIWPPLRAAVAAAEMVTLYPVLALRLIPRSSSGGQRVGQYLDGASLIMAEVQNDIVEAYTE